MMMMVMMMKLAERHPMMVIELIGALLIQTASSNAEIVHYRVEEPHDTPLEPGGIALTSVARCRASRTGAPTQAWGPTSPRSTVWRALVDFPVY